MALNDKNIVITPNIGQANDPSIVFSGADAVLGPQNITLQVYPTSNGTLSFEGSAGQLFSITNDLTGTIFSVNDVSGIPSIEVNANGTVSLAQFSGNVGIGTAAPTEKLSVVGTVSATLFSGSGASLTALNASNLSSGIVPDARISGSYTGMTNLTGTGNVDFSRFLGNAADTAALPSLSWTTDPNTGIFQPAADQVGISTGGTSRFTVSTTAIASTLPISASTFTGALSGNATTATTLQTARTIGGVSFNGSANINLPGVNTAGNQNTTGNAATATSLQTARMINGTSFNGTANIETTEWVHSDRDFPNGTLITSSINYAVTDGDPFILEIRGNSYGNAIPLDLQYQGYIYTNTIISNGGLSNGLMITGLVALNVGGNLCFWFPTQGYWNAYNVRVYTAYGPRAINKVTSITGVVKPAGTKEVSLTPSIRQSLHSSNFNSYSPTLTGTGASGTWGINVTGNAATASSVSLNSGKIDLVSGGGGASFASNHYSIGVDIANGGWSGPNYSDLIIGYHTGIRLGGAYSGIRFYNNSPTTDANNDGNGDGGESLLLTVGGSAGTGVNVVNALTSYQYQGNGNVAGTGSASYHPSGIYSTGTNWLYGTINMNGNTINGARIDGTIFYDANNTAFYVDPASTSVLNRISTVRTDDWLRMDNNYGHSVVGVYSPSRLQGVWSMGDSYKLPADGTTSGNLYGIAWSHPIAGAIGGANNLASHGMLILENGVFKGAWGGGSLRTPGDARATIFYDYDNTGYYVDPASTSSLNATNTVNFTSTNRSNFNGNQTATLLTGAGGVGGAEFVSNGAGAAFASYHRPGIFAAYFGLDTDNQFACGGWSFGAALGNMKVGSLGVGTTASGTAGTIRATNDITAYFSDERLKTFSGTIPDALEKVKQISGYYFYENDLAKSLGYDNSNRQVGVNAQEIEKILPEVIAPAAIDEKYLTVKYEKLVPLLIEAIKEQDAKIERLELLVEQLINNK